MNDEEFKDLCKNLSIAQGKNDRFSEAILIKKMYSFSPFNKDFKKLIKRDRPIIDRFIEKISFGSSGCWYWIACINKHGYGTFAKKLAHRISWEIHKGSIDPGLCVLHKCDVPSCVNPDHLFLGTHRENMEDMAIKNRGKNRIKGELNLKHKLTEKQVLEIRELNKKLSYLELSNKFNISRSNIYKVIKREIWRHI